MKNVKYFEDLRIWQEARVLVTDLYQDFQDLRDYGFRDQIQRAGISVMNNIAEGFERRSDAEFARFLDIAKSSCGEVRSMYYLAEDLAYIVPPQAERRREQARTISRGSASLISHLTS